MSDEQVGCSSPSRSPRWGIRALEATDLEALHAATLHVLERVGVRVEDEEAARVFGDAGAVVERRAGEFLVRLPAGVVEAGVEAAPERFTLCGRRVEDDFVVEPGATGFTAGFGEHVAIIDPYSRVVRPTTKQDVADITRVQDGLQAISFVERAACSGDMSALVQPVHNYDAMVRNTSKHVFLGFGGRDNARSIIAMAGLVAGGAARLRERPIVTCLVSPTSPLSLVTECTAALIEAARCGLGIGIHPMSLSGASSPATPAGVVVQHNAELLAAVVLAQTVRPGTPCLVAFDSTIMDLRRSASPIGVPELALHAVAGIQLAQSYGIPTWAGACGSDSKLPDAQQGYDFTLTALPAALAGANVIYGIGAIESAITFDYAAMIMGAEQALRIRRIVAGIDMDGLDEVVAVIAEVGPGGEYVSHDHTFEHMREMSSSSLFDRHSREVWEREGARDSAERAYQVALSILGSHRPLPLEADVETQLDEIVGSREREARGARG